MISEVKMKTIVVWRRWILLLSVCLCILAGCTSGAEKIERLLETLPVPPGATLLYQQEGEDQGSQDACYFPYTKQLYGTDQSFEQVVEFYENNLDPAMWDKWEDDCTPPGSPSWRRGKEFLLDLGSDPRLEFPEKVVSDAQSRYQTVYFLVVTYVDRIAREKCLGW